MATISFDEKVVVTNAEMVTQMHKDLDDPSPVKIKRKTNTKKCTMRKMEESAKKFIINLK